MLDYAFKPLLQSIKDNHCTQVLVPGVGETVEMQGEKVKPLATWEGHTSVVFAMTVLPDGTVVSGGGDTTLRRWDPQTGQCLKTWRGHTSLVWAVTVLPDGSVVSGCMDKTLRRWDPQAREYLNTWTGHTEPVYAVTVLPDGTMVSGGSDNTLRHWDSQTGQCLNTWTEHTSVVYAVAVLPDGTVVSGSGDTTLRHWDPQTGQCLNTWTGHTKSVNAVTVLPDGTVVSGGSDNTLRHWDPQTGQCLNTWRGHTSSVEAVTVLPDGTVVSGSYDKTLWHWNPQTGQCLNTWTGHTSIIYAVTVLPDGTVVSGSMDKTLRHWPRVGPTLTVAQLDEVLRALPSNTSVTTLSITDAALTDSVVALLAQGIQNHPTLTTLALDRCGLTQRQAQTLLAALIKSTCSVKTVSVVGNGLSSTLLEQFKNIVGHRQRQQTAELPAATFVSTSVSSSGANKRHTPAPRFPSASKPSTPPPAVVQVKALYSYIAQGAGQLSFHEGELFQLLNGEGDDWWQVVHKGQQGWVPRSYVAVVDKSAKPVAPASPVAASSSNSPSTTSLVNYPSLPRPW